MFFQYAIPGQCEVDFHIPYGGVNNPSGVVYLPPNGPSGGWSSTGTTFTAQIESDLLPSLRGMAARIMR